ncbi:MAG: NAD(P)/FAD-dependent oxidoreductase [Alphaproteobacteria bacterium]|nr:NAD(P)/FAD-dependent oxidoreductase [Alphaproteobacteria bacterium]
MTNASTARDGQQAKERGADTLDAVIIGAGFSGMYQLHLLRDRLGLKARVIERGDGVGGTWYWNRYPGARCDSESHSYSYYFSDELLKEWEWSERYPQQPEIVRYLNFVADKLDLKSDIQFETTVTAARYDEAANLWRIETDAGETVSAKYLITAVGCLSSANVPDIPGRDRFKGDWYHTGQWPHEGVDFTGKRVGQIGTGSTGIQAVPVIAETAQHLTVFQRTANYSIPANNHPLSAEFKAWARENIDEIRKTMHTSTNGHPFLIEDRKVFDVSAEERREIYEKAWEIGGLRFRAVFQDILFDKAANDTAADFLKSKIGEIVKDPETAKNLAAIDHPFATKRPPIDTGYFEAYNRDNVSLVNLRETPIVEITETGVKTTEREYDLDIIVFATGFDAMTGSLLKLGIVGRDGVSLNEAWVAGPRTYLGIQVVGFPNMFTITGPGSPSVLCNMPVAIEQHVEWITDCIEKMEKEDIDRVEPTEPAVANWVDHVNEVANATLLPEAGHSWYLGANVPGKPRVFMPYAGGMNRFRKICDDVVARGYDGFLFTRDRADSRTETVNA